MIRLVISDFDRTFTDGSLNVEPGIASAIWRLKKKGVSFSIVSGRSYDFLEEYCGRLDGLVDSYVAENGCIGNFHGKRHMLANCPGREIVFKRLESMGVPYGRGEVIFSVGSCHEGELKDALSGVDGLFHVVRNIDSLMVLPRGVSKSSGAAWLSAMHGVPRDETAAIGDAENDVHLRDSCVLLGAVSNAIPSMREAADYVCRHGYGKGLQEFLEYIEFL